MKLLWFMGDYGARRECLEKLPIIGRAVRAILIIPGGQGPPYMHFPETKNRFTACFPGQGSGARGD